MQESLPSMVDSQVKEVTNTAVLERENLRAEITSQINNAISNHIPSQANKSEPGPSTSGNQEQLDDFDFWTDKYATDDDELPTENVSQELMEEMSETVDESKNSESRKEILSLPFPQKSIPVVQSCQRDPKAPALSLVNQDLL
ncbi:hypothetical protein Tco_0881026 [Tanacetum coccineum]